MKCQEHLVHEIFLLPLFFWVSLKSNLRLSLSGIAPLSCYPHKGGSPPSQHLGCLCVNFGLLTEHQQRKTLLKCGLQAKYISPLAAIKMQCLCLYYICWDLLNGIQLCIKCSKTKTMVYFNWQLDDIG